MQLNCAEWCILVNNFCFDTLWAVYETQNTSYLISSNWQILVLVKIWNTFFHQLTQEFSLRFCFKWCKRKVLFHLWVVVCLYRFAYGLQDVFFISSLPPPPPPPLWACITYRAFCRILIHKVSCSVGTRMKYTEKGFS